MFGVHRYIGLYTRSERVLSELELWMVRARLAATTRLLRARTGLEIVLLCGALAGVFGLGGEIRWWLFFVCALSLGVLWLLPHPLAKEYEQLRLLLMHPQVECYELREEPLSRGYIEGVSAEETSALLSSLVSDAHHCLVEAGVISPGWPLPQRFEEAYVAEVILSVDEEDRFLRHKIGPPKPIEVVDAVVIN